MRYVQGIQPNVPARTTFIDIYKNGLFGTCVRAHTYNRPWYVHNMNVFIFGGLYSDLLLIVTFSLVFPSKREIPLILNTHLRG